MAQENKRNAASMATSHTNPACRRQEQITDTYHKRLTRQTNPLEIRAQENERNAAYMATRHTDPSYRRQENERNAASMATRHTDPSYRRQEKHLFRQFTTALQVIFQSTLHNGLWRYYNNN
jgi:hypothetical protein